MNSEHRARQFREDLYFCSNFYPLPVGIEYKGLIYPTAENAYQVQKVAENLREPFVTMTAKEAKDAGAIVSLSDDWENQKLTIMYDIVRLKFRIPELAEHLINTEPERLIEYNDWGDTFWGVDSETGVGENHLGKILRRVRQELMEQQST